MAVVGPFAVELSRPDEGCALIALTGELDISTAPQLGEALRRATAEGARRIVVDLSGVSFVDASALGVLVSSFQQLRAADGTLAIVCPEKHIRRIFEITGLDAIFGIYASRAEALSVTTQG